LSELSIRVSPSHSYTAGRAAPTAFSLWGHWTSVFVSFPLVSHANSFVICNAVINTHNLVSALVSISVTWLLHRYELPTRFLCLSARGPGALRSPFCYRLRRPNHRLWLIIWLLIRSTKGEIFIRCFFLSIFSTCFRVFLWLASFQLLALLGGHVICRVGGAFWRRYHKTLDDDSIKPLMMMSGSLCIFLSTS
jgi:hypothetical protein